MRNSRQIKTIVDNSRGARYKLKHLKNSIQLKTTQYKSRKLEIPQDNPEHLKTTQENARQLNTTKDSSQQLNTT